MKARVICLLLLGSVLAVSCGRGKSHREIDPIEPETVKMIVNPYWSLSYAGTKVVEENGNHYSCDVLHLEASDSEPYYVGVVSSDSWKSDYKQSVLSFAQADLAEVKKISLAASSGSSDAYFDPLAKGSYVAVAYGVTSAGALSGSYALKEFTKEGLQVVPTSEWKVSYDGRETASDGAVVDIISVAATSDDTFRIDVTYDEYLKEVYDGNLADYFTDLSDYFFSGGVDLDRGSVREEFNRLLTGVSWTAYAIGFDASGAPTGKYAKCDFVIPSETPSAGFLSWLGSWKIGSAKVGKFTDSNKFYIDPTACSYDITIESYDPNWDYLITGWETGSNAENQAAWSDGSAYDFLASYDRDDASLVVTAQAVGNGSDDAGSYSVYLLGNVVSGGEQYVITTSDIPVGRAELASDGLTASLGGEKVRFIGEDASTIVTDFTSMQFYDIYPDTQNIYFYNYVPQFPLNMSLVSKASSSAPRAVCPAAMRRKATVHGRRVRAVPECSGVRMRKASGAAAPKAEVKVTAEGAVRQAIGTREKIN